MDNIVEGCMNCPLFEVASTCSAFCHHPAHTEGKRYIPVYAELREDYFAHWCPLKTEPVTIKLKEH